jgi:hypothetical protein
MRIANLSGRLVIVTDGGAVDVEKISDGRFPADPQAIYSQWAEFIGADASTRPTSARRPRPPGSCSPSG